MYKRMVFSAPVILLLNYFVYKIWKPSILKLYMVSWVFIIIINYRSLCLLENQLWSMKIVNISCLTITHGDYICFMLTLQCYYWGSNEQMTIWLHSYIILNLIQWLTISCTRALQYHTWENFGVPPIVKKPVNLANTRSLFTNILASIWFTCQYSTPTIFST